ncbi:TetR/AcrR family transcriptional regulator [Peterkaempfera bronchialis]|uniref:TetR/AcrR family transcriptional regulator n=1 Tax=Peterkaempfera bronchialis TaxID=2126346 RepID=A0A345T2A9_9ACTN|nr:TetR/AcrR family transcriptional regulator [Peterkaempfera bronchialis]AXI80114.1 TetR/AcrR family transcriptional regulator [Peterkaempfera bronchialis]
MKKTDGRRLRAEQTRRRMLDAALKLFLQNGYRATTIESIAQEAGVAVQTIYFSFGNKQKILKELIDLHVAGDEDPVPTLERPQVREALSEQDPREQLRQLARLTRTINERVASLLEMLRNAAIASGDGVELWEANKEQRRTVQRRFIDALALRQPLPGGRTTEWAVDVCYALLGPEMYHLLVIERGWTPEQWEAWAYDALCCHLLGPA